MVKLTRKFGVETQILCIDDFRGWPGFRDRFKYVDMVNVDSMLLYQFMQNVISTNATKSTCRSLMGQPWKNCASGRV